MIDADPLETMSIGSLAMMEVSTIHCTIFGMTNAWSNVSGDRYATPSIAVHFVDSPELPTERTNGCPIWYLLGLQMKQ